MPNKVKKITKSKKSSVKKILPKHVSSKKVSFLRRFALPILAFSALILGILLYKNLLVSPEINMVTTGDRGGTGRGSSAAGGGIKCSKFETKCGKSCVNTYSDNNNCGSCGRKCGKTQDCDSGKCITYNFKTDNNNCGTIGKKCTGLTTCQNGACANAFTACCKVDEHSFACDSRKDTKGDVYYEYDYYTFSSYVMYPNKCKLNCPDIMVNKDGTINRDHMCIKGMG